jgi:hypothetical protein
VNAFESCVAFLLNFGSEMIEFVMGELLLFLLSDVLLQTVNSTNNSVSLTDLEPYTVYTMTVRCMPLLWSEPRGFWSDNVTFTHRTLGDGKLESISPVYFIPDDRIKLVQS